MLPRGHLLLRERNPKIEETRMKTGDKKEREERWGLREANTAGALDNKGIKGLQR